MIWSVSTSDRRSGTARPVWLWKLSTSSASQLDEVGRAGERADDSGRGGDERRHQVGPAALALAALEIAVGRGGAALPRRELVGVHPQAHRASGVTPLGSG